MLLLQWPAIEMACKQVKTAFTNIDLVPEFRFNCILRHFSIMLIDVEVEEFLTSNPGI